MSVGVCVLACLVSISSIAPVRVKRERGREGGGMEGGREGGRDRYRNRITGSDSMYARKD